MFNPQSAIILILSNNTVKIMNQEYETYSISQASQMTGVSKNRIREWHAKGLLPQVEWIPVGTCNHRRFTQDDIN